MTIVQAQYSIAVCSECSNHGYRLNTGEAVQWLFVHSNSRESVDCYTELWKDMTLMATLDQGRRTAAVAMVGGQQL